jgi:ABC-type amino acid transport system permease subunit
MLSTVAVVYLVLVWSLSALARLLERRLSVETAK